jgi:hypothetical protein
MITPKHLAWQLLFGRRWPRSRPLEEGYAIVLPIPEDMPFLLRFALEELRHIDTENCKQILVVPDAWGTYGAAALRRDIAQFDDPRIAMASPRRIDYALVRLFKLSGAHTHWLACVNGTAQAKCAYAFLHDADAFLVERGGIERQYRECRDRGLYTLGVEYRPDDCLMRVDYRIPCTWELMYSVAWAFRHGPVAFKPGRWMSPHGELICDSMIQAQYRDYASGRIVVMGSPPEYLHFGGVICTYRLWRQWSRKATSRPIADQRLRLLVLALLEEIIPDPDGLRALPKVEELARGLTDPTAPVTYATPEAIHEYPTFRRRIETLCQMPTFQGRRADRIRDQLRPFDEYYANRTAEEVTQQQYGWMSLGLS